MMKICARFSSTLGHVLIGGGTGLIGGRLRSLLTKENFKVTVVSRVATGEEHVRSWKDISENGLPNDVSAIVNLAGEPIMTPFTYFGKSLKKKIWLSRVGSTGFLAHCVSKTECQPNVIITVTSTDIYPPGQEYTEDFFPTKLMSTSNFFTKLGADWEVALETCPSNIRRVSIRTGTVLDQDSALHKLLCYSSRVGLGTLGDGFQHWPWIHMGDLLYLILHCIRYENTPTVLNGVSPNIITNRELTTSYARILGKSIKYNISKTALKAIYGEERSNLMLEDRIVQPEETLRSGFSYKYYNIDKALKNVLRK